MSDIPLPGKLRYDEQGAMIFKADESQGPYMVADLPLEMNTDALARVRGWGMLTGVGGLNMTDEEAARYQDRLGRRLVNCWNLCALIGFTDEELEVLASTPAEVIRAILYRKGSPNA